MIRKFSSLIAALLLSAGPLSAAIEMSAWMSYQIRQEQTLDQYGGKFTSVCVFAYDFDAADNLRPAQPWVDTTLDTLMASKKPGRPVFITIVNDIETSPPQQHNGDLIFRVLSDPAKRAQHIQQIVALSARADGIDIDYEGLVTGTRPYYSQFIQELRAALPPGKLLSVVCQPKTDDSDGPRGNAIDWVAIQPYVDIMKVMTYYYSFGASAPGPSAPPDKVQAVTALAVAEIPLSKLHLVLTQFGWDWPAGGNGAFVHYGQAMQIAQAHGVTPFRDPTSQYLRVDYTGNDGLPHQIWFPDDTSLQNQRTIIQQQGANKIDVWELGVGDTNFWNWVQANTVNPNAGPDSNPVPGIAGISPSVKNAGDPGFSMNVSGNNFIPGSIVRWNGNDRPTSFVNAGLLTATISAGDIANPSTSSVSVFNPAPGGGNSAGMSFIVNPPPNPFPLILSLNPPLVQSGNAAYSMTVSGINFVPASVVRWNGQDRATTFVNSTTLSAAIPASDVVSVQVNSVTVFTPAPGGGTSNGLPVTVFLPVILNPIPTLDTLSPSAVNAGGPAFPLTVTGTNFVAGTVVRWNGTDRPTTFVSATQLTVAISAGDIASEGAVGVTVFNPAPGGGTSATHNFVIQPPSAPVPPPTLTSLDPTSVLAGSRDFVLIAKGTDFTPACAIRWNGTNRITVFISAVELRAIITRSDVTPTGNASVTVADANGQSSNAQTFLVVNEVSQDLGVQANDLDHVRAFPNAWRGDRHSSLPITFDRMTNGSTVRIFNISGQWIKSLEAANGSVAWDLTTDSGERVASGYYLYLVTDSDGHKAKGKLAIIK